MIDRRWLRCLAYFVFALGLGGKLPAQTDVPVTNEWRVTAFPHYPIKGNLSGWGYLGWVKNPDNNYTLWYGGAPGIIYSAKPWLQIWSGVLYIYTNNYTDVSGKQDTMEIRPIIGPKLFLPNKWKWNIYNLTRLEFRETYNHGTHQWGNVERLRSRFGVEIPLTSREKAWKLNTFYGVANVEPMYRFDKNDVDPFRMQFGVGYIANPRIRAELLYYGNWGRVTPSNNLAYTENIIRLNVKVAVKRALLSHVWNPGSKED